ncbi:MAG: SAM-dependent methyltransferase [Pseudomonadota bacterium]
MAAAPGRVGAALCSLLLALAPAGAARESEEDAPFVPSPTGIVMKMLRLAGVGPDDYVIDLGSGDGRIVLTAAERFGARGLGVEIRESLVARSRRAAWEQGVSDRVRFVQQDLFETDISAATVVTVYLLPDAVGRLRRKLLTELEPGTRVVSHDYPIEHWAPERVVELDHPDKVAVTGVARTSLYLYRVPAEVGGTWTLETFPALEVGSVALELEQRVTTVQGLARLAEGPYRFLDHVRLSGRSIAFEIPALRASFSGRVAADGTMSGTVALGGETRRWRASR